MKLTDLRVPVLVVALLRAAMDAAAQSSPPVEQPVAGEGQLVGSAISLVQSAPPATLAISPAIPRARRLTWDGNVSGEASGGELSPWGGNGQAWRVTTAVSYSTANVTFGLGLQGQHGYQLPSSMSFALGEVSALDFRHPGFVDATGGQVWEARLVMKRRLAGSRGGASVEAVTEAFLPLGRDAAPPDVPGSYMPIRSRALRFGLVISY